MSYWTPSGPTLQITSTAQDFISAGGQSGNIALISNLNSSDKRLLFLDSDGGITGNYVTIPADSAIHYAFSALAPLVVSIDPPNELYIQPGYSPQINRWYTPTAIDPILQTAPFAWYDPSDITTLYQDSAMTTPVTADSDPVGAMLDLSGNGNHLLQATAGFRPLYKTLNGLHWLEFDGVDDGVIASVDAISAPFDRITAFRQLSGQNDLTLIGGPRLFRNNGIIRLNASGVGPGDPGNDIDFLITERFDAGAADRGAIDNDAYSDPGDASDVNNSEFYVGFYGPGPNNWINIRFYGSVMCDRALTDPEIALIRTYLAEKQGRVL